MKYMISWSERPQGSPMEYENAQKRILEVFLNGRRPTISRSSCSSYEWVTGVAICCWTATIRWQFTSSARCCLHLYSKHGQWFPLWMLSEWSLKRLHFVMGSKASNIRQDHIAFTSWEPATPALLHAGSKKTALNLSAVFCFIFLGAFP